MGQMAARLNIASRTRKRHVLGVGCNSGSSRIQNVKSSPPTSTSKLIEPHHYQLLAAMATLSHGDQKRLASMKFAPILKEKVDLNLVKIEVIHK